MVFKTAAVVAVLAVGLYVGQMLLLRKAFVVHASGAVVVTGASSGIGRHAAVEIARKGYTVFAGVRKEADAKSLEGEGVPTLRPVIMDVTKDDQVAAVAGQVAAFVTEHKQPLVGVVNNAGISTALPLEIFPMEQVRRVMEVNFFGVLTVQRHFSALLRKSHGRLVNIGSVCGFLTTPGRGVYSGSKHALEALSDASRLELAQFGVSVSLVQPAYVATKIAGKGMNARTLVSDSDATTYAPFFDSVDKKRKKSFENADDETVTTAAIDHALFAKYPETRYAVAKANGIPAWLLRRIKALLPDRAFDLVVSS